MTQPLRSGALVLIDQAIVSGASFATTIVVARLGGATELAIYALAVTLLLLLGSVLDALVAQPYTVYAHRIDGAARATYLGSAFAFLVVLAICATLGLLAAGVLFDRIGPARLAPMLMTLAVVAPCWLLREFARRIAFAHLAAGTGLLLDGSVAVAQLGSLAWLAGTGQLSGITALFAIAAATAVGGTGWLAASGRRLRVRPSCVGRHWRMNWRLGRWILASRVMTQLNSDMTVAWLLLFLAGPAAAGVFAACLTVVFLSNPIVLAAGLFLTPWIARTAAREGVVGTRRIVWQATAALAVVLTLIVAALSLLADPIMHVMYGSQYAGLHASVFVLAVAIAISALGLAAGTGLLAIERADLSLLASVCGFVVLVVAAPALISDWTVFGAGLALIAGNAVETATRLRLFYRHTRTDPRFSTVVRAPVPEGAAAAGPARLAVPDSPENAGHATTSAGRVAFVTNICAHYRVDAFETLARHHDVDYYFYSDGGERYWQRKLGVHSGAFDCEYLPGFTLWGTRITPTLPFKLWRGHYDAYVKCINGRFALPLTYLVARLKRKPLILWTGIWARPRTLAHRLFAPATRYIYRHSDAIVVYGAHVKRFLEDEGVPARRIFVAAQAVDNRLYNRQVSEPARAQLRRDLNIDPDLKVILYLGRLEEEKGLPFLIDAFASLGRDDAVLVIAGAGSQRERLAQLARDHGIADRVRFPGHIPLDQTVRHYALAWVYVLPSITTRRHKETWGLVVNEAFNQGLPVIATDAVGAAAGGLIQDGVNGYIVPERDSPALARALRWLLDDPARRSRMSHNARRSVRDWDTERMVMGFQLALAFALGQRTDERLLQCEPPRGKSHSAGLALPASPDTHDIERGTVCDDQRRRGSARQLWPSRQWCWPAVVGYLRPHRPTRPRDHRPRG